MFFVIRLVWFVKIDQHLSARLGQIVAAAQEQAATFDHYRRVG